MVTFFRWMKPANNTERSTMLEFLHRTKPGRNQTRQPGTPRKPRLEALEDRTLLSVDVLVNFDAIDAYSAGQDGVRGQVVSDYLAGYGISVSGSTPRVFDTRSGNQAVVPPSAPNVFNAPSTRQFVTFNFDAPLERFSVTRAGLHVTGAGGTTHPAWSATALDAQGTVLASVSEPLLARFQDIPAQQYTLVAPGIRAIRFYSDNQNFAGYGFPLLDDFILTKNPLDIAMQSAQHQAGNTVQFTYATTGTPGPFEVGLYRSTDGITYNAADVIATQTVTPSPTNPQTPSTFTLPSPWTPDPSKPYLVVVADPDDLITESNPNNNSKPIALPDIAMTSAQLVSTTAVQFTYSTVGNPGQFIARLYRSADTTFDAAIDQLVPNQAIQYITPSPTNPQAPGTITLATPVRPNAQLPFLLVVATPVNTIPEPSIANNAVVALQPGLTLSSINDADPTRPNVSYVSLTRLDEVRWFLDSTPIASIAPLESGQHNLTLPDLRQLSAGRHTLLVQGIVNGVIVAQDRATLNNTSLGRQVASENFLVFIMIEGVGLRSVHATVIFNLARWEWSLPGSTVNRKITKPVLVLTSSIENDLEIIGGASLEINGTRSVYNQVPSIGHPRRWGAAFEIPNFELFVRSGTQFSVGISLAVRDPGGFVPFLNRTITGGIQ